VPRPSDPPPARPPGPRGGRRVVRTNVWYGPGYGYYGPYGYGWYGPGWGSPYGAPYGYYGGYYGGYDRGSLRIDVEPEETEVYVDGYYAGVVDSYDGVFQRLHLPPGRHDVELRLEGYRGVQEQIYLAIGSTQTITHLMEPLGPGETTPPPPEPPDLPELPDPAAAPFGQGAPFGPGAPPPPPGVPGVAASPADGFATLRIRVQPDDALILVDGEEWRSPQGARLDLALGVGRHRIEVQRDGYESYVTDVELRGGESTTVNISLPRAEEAR